MSGKKYPILFFVMSLFVELLSYIAILMAILDNLNPMGNFLSIAHQVFSNYYLFTFDFYFYMLFVILNSRVKITYLEQKKIESFYSRLISVIVTLLKKLMNGIKKSCDVDEINSIQMIVTLTSTANYIFLHVCSLQRG